MSTNPPLSTWSRIATAGCLAIALSACDSSNKTSQQDSEKPTSSSSSSSSSGDVASISCSASEAHFCGDFDDWSTEQEPALPAGWSISNSAGTSVTVSSEQAFSGEHSIKVVSAGGGYNRGFLTMDLTQAAPLQQEMFGRIMIYVTDENAHAGDFTFLQAEGSTPKGVSGAPAGTEVMFRGRIDQRYDHVFTNYDTWLDEDADNVSDWPTDCAKQPYFTETMAPSPQYILPKNEWSCIQWHIKQNRDHIDITLNGNSLSDIRVYGSGHSCENSGTQAGAWYAPQLFERLHVGIEQYADDALPRTVYIDDVTVHTDFVGCDGSLSHPSNH